MAAAGKNKDHGAWLTSCRASFTIRPQSGFGGWTPTPVTDPGSGGAGKPKDFMAMVAEYRAAHKCGVVDAQKAVMNQYPDAHAAYIKSVN